MMQQTRASQTHLNPYQHTIKINKSRKIYNNQLGKAKS